MHRLSTLCTGSDKEGTAASSIGPETSLEQLAENWNSDARWQVKPTSAL